MIMAKARTPISLRLYRGSTRIAGPLTSFVLNRRLKRGKEDPERIGERHGIASLPRPGGPLVWVHGASVGEVLAVFPLLGRIRKHGFSVLLTSGTVTAAQIASDKLPEGVLHQFLPLDTPKFMKRFLDHWQPNLALLTESELWPNLILQASAAGTPLVLINGRLSERSFARWKKMRRTAAALLSRIDLLLVQEPEDAQRFAKLGAQRISTIGNLKFDVAPPEAEPRSLAALERSLHRRTVILAASTHGGEEEAVIEAHRRLRRTTPGLVTIIVPRHPQRGGAVADVAQQYGLPAVLRSHGYLPDRGTEIYIADTIGEMGLFYRLAPIVFMGGSLVRHGGQNPIEPAKIGSAILHGPYVSNFTAIYGELNRMRGAATVTDAESLTNSLQRLLDDPALVERMKESAYATVMRMGGALERTLNAIQPYLVQLRLR
jgi:3-deoxy-D-manno-octulosonic-acid transferase